MLYVGRATSLRDRIKSYFVSDIADIRSPLIEKIVSDAKAVKWEETDSVLEAIILEAKQIKEHKPVGNTDNKDNKSWNYLGITDEAYPRVLIIRERELEHKGGARKLKALFGPFTSAGTLRDALKIVRKIFPFFDTPFPVDGKLTPAQEKTLRFNQSIGLYPKVFDEKEYKRTIRAIIELFSGKKSLLIKRLEREMNTAAKKEHFEEAQQRKREVFALNHIQDITLIKEELRAPKTSAFRVEAYDVAHLKGASPRGVMTVVVNGEAVSSEYRTFTIRSAKAGDDYAALEEVLTRRLGHPEWPLPRLMVIDGGKGQLGRAKKTLEEFGVSIELVSVVKDEKHRPREILGKKETVFNHEAAILLANAEAHRFSVSRHRKAFRRRG